MRYDGGKGTCYPQIINLMPPHRRYIETHLGGGAVMRHKSPAAQQLGIDLDATVIELWKRKWPSVCQLLKIDAVDYLADLNPDKETVVYADPPYHPDTRRRSKVYRCDYTINDHERLLECLTALRCKVMLSGYMTPLYEKRLAGWSLHRFPSRTRADTREECIWFNFKKPEILHDDRYLGAGFREREVIRRRQARMRNRIGSLSLAEQKSLRDWLDCRLEERGER